MANPIQFEPRTRAAQPDCLHCQELLADAVDEILSPADRIFFDRHVDTCADCSTSLADAVRGAAWLQLLNTPRPEPSADLVDRILAQTSDRAHLSTEAETSAAQFPDPVQQPAWAPAWKPMLRFPAVPPTQPETLLAFRPRVTAGSSAWDRMRRLAFEPRLAMTAAMAFFSIALTMNITGVRLDQLHPSDLSPSNLRHTYFSATASVARRYDSLRVVHVLESRVEDLRELNGDDNAPLRRHPQRTPAAQTEPDSGQVPDGKRDGRPAQKPDTPHPVEDHGISSLAAPDPRPSGNGTVPATPAVRTLPKGGLA